MTRIFTFLFFALLTFNTLSGQTINNFESISPAVVTRHGATFSVATNPVKSGLNTSATVGKIGRSTGNWYELIGFPTNFTIPALATRYVHVLVNYPAQPDVSIRIDAPNETVDGAKDIRSINASGYKDFGKWYNLTFKIDSTNTARSVKSILYLGDLGFENTPAARVLNNTDKFAYVDQFVVSNNPILTNTKNIEEINAVSVHPNPTVDQITISNLKNDTKVSIYGIDGKEVFRSENHTESAITVPVTSWQKGMYFLTIEKAGDSVFKKFIVE
jgi:hypothetical protein